MAFWSVLIHHWFPHCHNYISLRWRWQQASCHTSSSQCRSWIFWRSSSLKRFMEPLTTRFVWNGVDTHRACCACWHIASSTTVGARPCYLRALRYTQQKMLTATRRHSRSLARSCVVVVCRPFRDFVPAACNSEFPKVGYLVCQLHM